jgi:hypothetical protein
VKCEVWHCLQLQACLPSFVLKTFVRNVDTYVPDVTASYPNVITPLPPLLSSNQPAAVSITILICTPLYPPLPRSFLLTPTIALNFHYSAFHIHLFMLRSCINCKRSKMWNKKSCKNPGRQVARATKFCTVAPNVCGSSVWNLPYVTTLVPGIL